MDTNKSQPDEKPQGSTKPKEPTVIETASATTSKDNSNSGPFAYVITAVAVGTLLVLSLASAGCVAALVGTAVQEASTGRTGGTATPYADPNGNLNVDNMQNMDFEEFLKQYEKELNSYGGNGSSTSSSSKRDSASAPISEVLDYQIAPFGDTIDDCLSASSYSGVPNEVRDYVRKVVSTDKDYVGKLQTLLNAIAHDDSQREVKLKEAAGLCDEANKAIAGLEVPSIANDKNGATKDMLGTAKSEAAHRWELMKAEVNVLAEGNEVDTKKLWRADEDVVESTEDAAALLEDAMDQASSN